MGPGRPLEESRKTGTLRGDVRARVEQALVNRTERTILLVIFLLFVVTLAMLINTIHMNRAIAEVREISQTNTEETLTNRSVSHGIRVVTCTDLFLQAPEVAGRMEQCKDVKLP